MEPVDFPSAVPWVPHIAAGRLETNRAVFLGGLPTVSTPQPVAAQDARAKDLEGFEPHGTMPVRRECFEEPRGRHGTDGVVDPSGGPRLAPGTQR